MQKKVMSAANRLRRLWQICYTIGNQSQRGSVVSVACGGYKKGKIMEPDKCIKEWIINDYFTPNIKAEVILNTLLTPFVAEIIEEQMKDPGKDGHKGSLEGELSFITKEMSIMESEDEDSEVKGINGNRGTKIDYVLGDEKAIYLVELKTTDSNTKQAERYLENCCGKTFGEVFGNRLLSIMRSAFGTTYRQKFPEPLESSEDIVGPQWKEENLSEAFSLVFEPDILKGFRNINESYMRKLPTEKYANAARELIRKAGWTQKDGTRSRKYLYTAGQLLEYCKKYQRTLWDKPLQLIYLTPQGKCPSDKLKKKEAEDFYIGSLSLGKAGEYLKNRQEDKMAQLLYDIIKDCL